jgi:hypothetical protein
VVVFKEIVDFVAEEGHSGEYEVKGFKRVQVVKDKANFVISDYELSQSSVENDFLSCPNERVS